MMSDFIRLVCPSCGSSLQIGANREQFACAHCGSGYLVRRDGDAITLDPIMEELRQVRTVTERAAAELRIPRLEAEIADIDAKIARLNNPTPQTKPDPRLHGGTLGAWLIALGLLSLICFAAPSPWREIGLLICGGAVLYVLVAFVIRIDRATLQARRLRQEYLKGWVAHRQKVQQRLDNARRTADEDFD